MRKGFTLLELLIVIMIIGVLAVVAMVQYNNMSERARAAEAKIALAHIRSAEQFYYERWDTYTNQLPNLAVEDISVPVTCNTNGFFSYSIISASGTGFVINATRCTSGGKSPNAQTSYFVSMNQSGAVVSPFH